MSEQPKHTPGPWEIREETVGNRVVTRVIGARYPGGHKPIATLSSGFTCFAEDARLIAAAPDLLAALRAVVAVADRATAEFDLARAAIAKAEGGAR